MDDDKEDVNEIRAAEQRTAQRVCQARVSSYPKITGEAETDVEEINDHTFTGGVGVIISKIETVVKPVPEQLAARVSKTSYVVNWAVLIIGCKNIVNWVV